MNGDSYVYVHLPDEVLNKRRKICYSSFCAFICLALTPLCAYSIYLNSVQVQPEQPLYSEILMPVSAVLLLICFFLGIYYTAKACEIQFECVHSQQPSRFQHPII